MAVAVAPTSPQRRNPLLGSQTTEQRPTNEIGAPRPRVSGADDWATFLDEAETTPDFTFPRSVETCHAMRADSQVDALHIGTVAPIKEFRWAIDPNGAPAGLAENAASDLGLPIKGHEDDTVPRARNRFDWDTFLGDALLAPLYGFFDFEIAGGVVEGKEWRLDKLGPRHPRLTESFRENDVGELTAIRQRIGGPHTNGLGMPEPIPADHLVRFVWRPEAGSFVGRPMLRSMFREWAVKDRTMRIAAINLQRAGGVPVIEGASGMSDSQLRDLAVMARQFKVAEGGGGAVPFGTKLNLVGGSVPDAISLLKYCDESMARVWALMLVQLGMTATGNRALGAEFAIYAARAQRSWAKWVKASVDGLLDRYVEWNDPFITHAPLLVFEQDKPDATSTTDLVAAVESKLITVDPELEEWLRSEWGLPERPEDEPEPVAEPEGVPAAAVPSVTLDPTAQSPTLARGGASPAHPLGVERVYGGIRASLTLPARDLRRPPSANEIRAAVDFRGLDTAHSETTTRLQQAWLKDVLPPQIGAMGEQIRGLSSLTKTSVADVTAPVLGLDMLQERLVDAAVSGAKAAKREMVAQGKPGSHVALAPDTPAALASRVADQAVALGKMNANAVSLAAQRKAAALVSAGGRSPEQVAGLVEDHLKGQKHVWEREQLRGAVTMAQNQGRIAAFQSQPDAQTATYEASELLDERTCLHPTTRLMTERGPVQARRTRRGDRLLTHTGRFLRPDEALVSGVDDELICVGAGGATLRLTAAHRVLVAGREDVRWVYAGDLAVGDLVVGQEALEMAREAGCDYLRLRESPDREPARFEIGSLPSVGIGAQCMPIVAVGLDDESAKTEVNDPRTDLCLAGVGEPEIFEHFADPALDGRLGVGGHVAAPGAVASAAGHTRDDPEADPAMGAVDQRGWPSTRLRAVSTPAPVSVTERRTATLARSADASGRQRAPSRAVVVARGVGDGHLKGVATLGARFRHAVARAAGVGVRVGAAAGVRAVDRPSTRTAEDLAATHLAVPRRGSALRGSAGVPALAAHRPPGDGLTTDGTELVHKNSVLVVGVRGESYSGPVYDFSLSPDRSYFAEGLLVHNCDPCAAIDGTVFDSLEEASEAYAGGGYVDCEGGPNCRGVIVAVYAEQNPVGSGGPLNEAEPAMV